MKYELERPIRVELMELHPAEPDCNSISYRLIQTFDEQITCFELSKSGWEVEERGDAESGPLGFDLCCSEMWEVVSHGMGYHKGQDGFEDLIKHHEYEMSCPDEQEEV